MRPRQSAAQEREDTVTLDRVLTIDEVAEALRLAPRVVRALAANRASGLRGSKVGKRWLFNESAVAAYIAGLGSTKPAQSKTETP